VLANGFLHLIAGAPLTGEIDIVDLAQLSARSPEWVKAHLGREAAGADQALGAASLALMRGGVAVRVRKSATALLPLHLRFVNPGRGQALMSHTRVLVVLDDGAELDLLESHAGCGQEQILANFGVEVVLGRSAKLTHIRLQEEGSTVVHIASGAVQAARDAQYRAVYVNLGGRLSRIDMNLRLAEPGAEAVIRSVTALGGESVADVTTVIDHAAPHTTSRQLYKNVLGGRARSVSQGRVAVREGAVKVDSHQLFKALLLSPRAEADAKPELEIFADDVICGHGTAIGAVVSDALFYLRSRGISEAEARSLLVRAFLEDAIEDFTKPEIHDALWRQIEPALATIGAQP
jgi:Fe-S cluster assembly protein SufD